MTESCSSISAVSSVGSSPSAAYDVAEAEVKSKELKHHGKVGKATDDDSSDDTDGVPSNWGFDKEQAHKLQENLCNACVNTIKTDDARIKDANDDLKKSTEIGG